MTRVLLPRCAHSHLRQADFLAVIDGMQMDAAAAIVAPELAELDLYCDRVAAAVGRLSVRAFGDASAAADDVAWHLGRALQLTNILRDIAEDAARGRLYLPRELLRRGRRAARSRGGAAAIRGLPAVCERLAAMAHGHFARPAPPWRAATAARCAGAADGRRPIAAILAPAGAARLAPAGRAGQAAEMARSCGSRCGTG